MDAATAEARLRRMVAADSEPTLDALAIADLLTIARRPDPAGNTPRNQATADTWAATTGYLVDQIIQTGTSPALRYWRVTRPGVSASAVPAWPTLTGDLITDTLVTDGTVTWADAGSNWSSTWRLARAAAEGWRWKAAKVAGEFNFATDGQSFNRREAHAMCLEMAARYSRMAPTSLAIISARTAP